LKGLGEPAAKHFEQFATLEVLQYLVDAYTECKRYTEAAFFLKRQLHILESELVGGEYPQDSNL
jgi:glutamate mutase epsilon subunit